MTSLSRQILAATNSRNELDACEALVAPLFSSVQRNGYLAFDSICQANGISVKRINDSSLPYRGRFQWSEDDRPEIELRTDINVERERFTLAHELGHWLLQSVLPSRKNTLFRGLAFRGNEHNEEEELADLLAAELLMPRQLLNKPPQSIESFREQCIRFGVAKHDLIKRHAMASDCHASMVHVVPALPDDNHSYATVDDACLVTNKGKVFEGRDAVTLESELRFSDLPDGPNVELMLNCGNKTSIWRGFTYFDPGLLPEIVFVSFHKN